MIVRTTLALAFAGALAAQQQDPILAKLSAETTNVVVVRDLVPVLDALLATPVVGKLLEDTTQLQRTAAGRAFDAPSLRRQLELLAPMIPVEIVIAAPTRTMDRLSHAAPLFACCTVLQMLARAKVTDDATLAPIRKAAQQHLAQLDGVPLQAWVRVRDERTAESWFDTIAGLARAHGNGLGFTTELGDARITLRGEPFAKGSPVRNALDAAGIDASTAPAVVVEATIEQRGASIELTVGKLAPPPCAAARLQPWTGNVDALLFARSECGDGVAYLTSAYGAVSALGDAELADGDTALMLQLIELLQRVDTLTTDQSASLRVDHGLVWEHDTQHEQAPGMDEADVPPELARVLRPEDGPFAATCDTLDVALTALVQTMWPLRPGDGPYSASMLVHAQWADLIEFLDGDESAVFAPGCALVTRATTLPAAGKRPALPVPAVAVVALPTDPAAGNAFMAALATHVAAGAGVKTPLWREQDLGLSVPTHVLDVAAVAPQLQSFVDPRAFAPHWFTTDGLLVLSSDPALSKDLIARARGEQRPLPHARLARWAQIRGEHLDAAVGAAGAWWQEIGGDGPAVAPARAVLGALRAAAAHVELVETVSFVDGTVERDRISLRLREPAPK